ncbi:MAG: hypothetical protein ABS808_05555 [Wolbachia endosymbiont of Polyergus mexicanus]|uniref:Uncharacterized protein n=1 Tax=Wolbachia endosymbiont of Polyergus mexicanus TaxID=3171167 RepID=A0AAU7YH55_9RICK
MTASLTTVIPLRVSATHNCTNVVVWATSGQCPDTGIQLLCNLIKNVCFSVRQLPLAHQLSYKQNFWIPVPSTGMTPFAVFKNECSYSYA